MNILVVYKDKIVGRNVVRAGDDMWVYINCNAAADLPVLRGMSFDKIVYMGITWDDIPEEAKLILYPCLKRDCDPHNFIDYNKVETRIVEGVAVGFRHMFKEPTPEPKTIKLREFD